MIFYATHKGILDSSEDTTCILTNKRKKLAISPVSKYSILIVLSLCLFAISLFAVYIEFFASTNDGRCPQLGVYGSPGNASRLEDAAEDIEIGSGVDLRLPKGIVPEHYDIELQPFLPPPGNFSFHGKVQILFNVTKDLMDITLHIFKLTVDHNSLKLTTDQNVTKLPKVAKASVIKEKDFFVVHLTDKLEIGVKYQLSMKFVGLLDKKLGFYRSHYPDPQNENKTRWLATSKFEPTHARWAYPCFDEPALKATFNITLVRTKDRHSRSNMPLLKTEKRSDGWFADHFQKTPPMSTYLAMFLVSDFVSKGDGTYKMWARPQVIEHTEYALEVGQKTLKFLEEFLGVKYPLPKLDHVAVPQFPSGAMENWGIITYLEPYLVYNPKNDRSYDQEATCSIVAHEQTHQWFGDLVTMKWWNELWLNEGFATLFEYISTDAAQPDWRYEEIHVMGIQKMMAYEIMGTTRPIDQPAMTFKEIRALFDKYSYDKAAAVLRMTRYFLGDEFFRAGLKDYLTTHEYTAVTSDDLFASLTKVQSGKDRIDTKKILSNWFLQAGCPMVTVTRNYTSGNVTLVQSVLSLSNSSFEKLKGHLWSIPITYTDGSNPTWQPKTKYWLHEQQGNLGETAHSKDWIIMNIRVAGYYKVNYDPKNWKMLEGQLLKDHKKIHVSNRAQILDDILDFARAGKIKYENALDISRYLKAEMEYTPWLAFLKQHIHITIVCLKHTKFSEWKKFLISIMEPVAFSLGWKERHEDDLQTKYLRAIILHWLCRYGHHNCTALAAVQESQFGSIAPNLRPIVLCAMVRQGDETTWKTMLKRSSKPEYSFFRGDMLNSLGCAKQSKLQKMFLNLTLTRHSDLYGNYGGIKEMSNNLHGAAERSCMFYIDRWKDFLDVYGKKYAARIIQMVCSGVNTKNDLKQISDFYLKNQEELDQLQFKFLVEEVQHNIEWIQTKLKDVMNWLKNHPKTSF